ncbi:tumor necrosis factor receptor superfamily member 10C-like [Physella acuta]|uniref:tumor necrosis factor receptor superfamily member 10C-like n=1 Tax=Physella acuta TaxID=109671 RepID=UPI0027DB7BE1|nr:tumor necrosis factor receptor superfamily member 10C-like [Physella acuta]
MPTISIKLGTALFFLHCCNLLSAIVSGISPHHESDQSFGTCDPDVPSRALPKKVTLRVLTPTAVKCPAGEFLDTVTSQCQTCGEGYFMTAMMAASGQHTECEKCYQLDTINERLVTPCNSTRDAEILCTDGFYRHKTEDGKCYFECLACSLCGVGESLGLNYPARPCAGYTDVKCCRHADDVIGEDGTCVRAEQTLNSTHEEITKLPDILLYVGNTITEPPKGAAKETPKNEVSAPKASACIVGFLIVFTSLHHI